MTGRPAHLADKGRYLPPSVVLRSYGAGVIEDPQQFMRQAVDEAALSPGGDTRVGAVLVTRTGLVFSGHKDQDAPPRRHAEVVALDKATAAGADLGGATAFVTLEPCANLEGNRVPCSDRLAAAGVSTVYIGRLDRMPLVNVQGWKALTERGVRCLDFTAELRDELDQLNSTQNGWFLRRNGLRGKARFDHKQNGGIYELATDDSPDAPTWVTEWTEAGASSIYAYGKTPGFVAHARYARLFGQIDDPDAYDYGNSSAALSIGEIAIYRNEHGHALVRLLKVKAGPDWGTSHTELVIDYELRPTTAPSDGDAP
jgi:diaminohydroxyphosphoribosylaminopyrimidine deaminase/5-amino-6-(5-phosphoribosylamino)uracil reductase